MPICMPSESLFIPPSIHPPRPKLVLVYWIRTDTFFSCSLLLSGLTNETSSGTMKRMKHFVTICLLGLLLLEVSHKEMELTLLFYLLKAFHVTRLFGNLIMFSTFWMQTKHHNRFY